MEIVIYAASPLYSKLTSKIQKPRKFRTHSCLRLEGQDNMKKPKEQVKSLITGLNVKHDIGKLFQEAQQNILYLNKQRLVALEDLNETKRENQLLLDMIEQLKVEKEANTGKDKLVIFWELMFRIDSMVLTGMVGTKEASDFRRLLLDSIVSVTHVFSGIVQKSDAELLTELRQFSVTSKKSGLHIIHICTEMAPVVSDGSLASYVTGLSRALQRKGNLVEVILPKYSSLDLNEVHQLREIEAEFYSYFNGQMHTNKAWAGFTYFSRASLDYIVKSGKQPDVLHIHNWETAIVGPLFWDIFVKQGLEGTRILLTCHDSDSQCLEKPEKIELCGLDRSRLHRPDRMQDDTKTHLLNVLKGGIVYSNRVVLVPSMHSKDQTIYSLRHGLESILAPHKDKMIIAPYGFDDSTWNPAQDQFLPKKYAADDMKGKAVCKLALQHHAQLSKDPSIVLVGCILSKISDVDLEILKAKIRTASKRGIQFIIMGINQISSVNTVLESFQYKHEEEKVRIIEYEEGLLHLLFAGSDIILCQSLHDPVLQVPLKALKYGAAPIAINISDDKFRHVGSENTKYTHYINTSFANMSLSQALDEIENDPLHWNRKMADAMTKNFSWDGECYDIHISAYRSMKSN